MFGFGILGVGAATITVLLLPSRFRADAAFQAEVQAPASLPGGLAGLASQFGGLQLNTQSNPQLLGDLLRTDAVLSRVAGGVFPGNARTATLAAVYGYDDEAPALRDYLTIRKLRKALAVDVNIRTGVVRFSIEAGTPELAQALAESSLAALNAANIALRQARAGAEQSFTSERAESSRMALSSAEDALAEFYQRNRIVNSPSLQMEESRLRRVVDMAQQVYVQLQLQQEQAAIQAVRNTPAISVIDPPRLPVRRSWPKKRLGVGLGLVIGLAVGIARVALIGTMATTRSF